MVLISEHRFPSRWSACQDTAARGKCLHYHFHLETLKFKEMRNSLKSDRALISGARIPMSTLTSSRWWLPADSLVPVDSDQYAKATSHWQVYLGMPPLRVNFFIKFLEMSVVCSCPSPIPDYLEVLIIVQPSLRQSAKTRPGTNCGSDHELLIAKFRLNWRKWRKPLNHSGMT